MRKRYTSFTSLLSLAACLFCSNALAQQPEETYYEEQVPAEGAYYEEQVPAEGAYYEEQVPAEGVYYEEQVPAEGAYYEEQMPAEGAYYEEQMPAEGAYYEEQMPAEGAYYEEQMPAEDAYYEEQMPAESVYFSELAGIPTKGFFLHAAFSIPSIISMGVFEDGGASYIRGSGFGVNFQAIYRFTYDVGLGLEQRIEGIFNSRNGYAEKGEGVFLGASFVIIQEYIHQGDYGLFTFTQGLGIAYGAKDKKLFSTHPDRGFALKIDFGYTYFIQSTHGVGLTLEFMLANYTHLTRNAHTSWLYDFTPMITYKRFF